MVKARAKAAAAHNLAVRLPGDLWLQIEAAAERAGRTVSDETRERLVESFRPKQASIAAPADAREAEMMQTIAYVLSGMRPEAGGSVLDSPDSFAVLRSVLQGVLDIYKPEGEPSQPVQDTALSKHLPVLARLRARGEW